MSRSDKSFKNIGASLLMTTINVIFGFITQRIFAKQLGIVNLGINGLFTNIISILSIADLGIGTAIVYNMYKPISEKNVEKIKSLMALYRKSYRIISLVVLFLGIIISPFLRIIIGNNSINVIDSNINIFLVFYLYLADTVLSYLLTYKRSMLYANQKNYIINIVHTICIFSMYSIQIASLLIFKNFYIFLIIKILSRLIENIIINLRVDKEYTFLMDKNINELDIETNRDISKRVRASILHNIGSYIVLSTDNIIISYFIGIEMVGIYSNYLLIINALNNFIGQVFASITASVGNLLVEKNFKKINQLCDNFNNINFWIYTIAGCVLYGCIQPFIRIWLGDNYLLYYVVVIVLAINFFFQGMRRTMQVFAEAGGICYENRFVPIAEAILNIIFSILLVKYFGLAGVILGTIISSFVLHFYSYPKYVYKNLLHRESLDYVKQFLLKLFIYLIVLFLCVLLTNNIIIKDNFIKLFLNFIVCLLISSSILYVIYRNSNAFKYFLNLLKTLFNKFKIN